MLTFINIAQIPSVYLDAIYANVPGSELVQEQGIYVVPCDAQIELSFIFR